MDFLTIALILLILLLSVFLTITGIQVIFILRDLKKGLDNFNKIIQTGGNLVADIEKPVGVASEVVSESIGAGAKALTKIVKKEKQKHNRFYKKVL